MPLPNWGGCGQHLVDPPPSALRGGLRPRSAAARRVVDARQPLEIAPPCFSRRCGRQGVGGSDPRALKCGRAPDAAAAFAGRLRAARCAQNPGGHVRLGDHHCASLPRGRVSPEGGNASADRTCVDIRHRGSPELDGHPEGMGDRLLLIFGLHSFALRARLQRVFGRWSSGTLPRSFSASASP